MEKYGTAPTTFSGKAENYWYHYKWHTIIIGFILLAVIIATVQCASKPRYDMTILYAGPETLSGEQYDLLSSNLSTILGRDLNGDGKISVGWEEFFTVDEVGNGVQAFQAQQPRDAMAVAGDLVLYFLAPNDYAQLSNLGVIAKLTDVFGADGVPSIAADAYSLKLADTTAYQNMGGLNGLPDDTVICFRNDQGVTFDKTKYPQRLADAVLFVNNLIAYDGSGD